MKEPLYKINPNGIKVFMKTEYDFSQSKPNPYMKKLRKQITIRIDADTIDYFRKKSEETGIPYQNLINLYYLTAHIN